MPRISYTVTATFSDARMVEEYIAWLRGGHLDGVIAGGAETAEVVRLDPEVGEGGAEVHRVETRYTFPSRERLDAYIRDHAPALRADGLRRFGPERGVTFSRRIGTFA